jgi:hypothetical protein
MCHGQLFAHVFLRGLLEEFELDEPPLQGPAFGRAPSLECQKLPEAIGA